MISNPENSALHQLDELMLIYLNYKEQADFHVEQMELIKEEINSLYQQGLIPDKHKNDAGTLVLKERRTYKFSPAVDQLKEQEKANGTATVSVSSHWAISTTRSLKN